MRTSRKAHLLSFFLPLVLAAANTKAANLLHNGDFEYPIEPCWIEDPRDYFPPVSDIDRDTEEQGDDDYEAFVYRGTKAGFSKLTQTVAVGSAGETTVSFSACLQTWRTTLFSDAVAMICIYYLDSSWNTIARTEYVKATYDVGPGDPTWHKKIVEHEDWFSESVNVGSEFSHFSGVSTGQVKYIQVVAMAIASGLMPGDATVWLDDVKVSGPKPNPPEGFLGLFAPFTGYSDDPVNTATGNFVHQMTDLQMVSYGRGPDIRFVRTYNSQGTSVGHLGSGWNSSFDVRLTDDTDKPSYPAVCIGWDNGQLSTWVPGTEAGEFSPVNAGLTDALRKNEDGTWTLTKKSLDVYRFDVGGRLTSMADRNNNALEMHYDDGAHPERLTNLSACGGRSLTFDYGAGGQLTSVEDHTGRRVEYGHKEGRLTEVTDVLGNKILYEYDANGFLQGITDQRSVRVVENTCDANGRVIEQLDGNGNLTSFAYDVPVAGNTTITDSLGHQTIHTHDNQLRLVEIKDPIGHTIYYAHDEDNNFLLMEDRNGNPVEFEYDDHGNVTKTVAADGAITTIEYDEHNLPIRQVDAMGNSTQWEYDPNGNLLRRINALGGVRSWTYNSHGQKLTERDEGGNTTSYTYDANGLLVAIVDALGNKTEYAYDDLWRRTVVTDANGHTTTYEYDPADRLIAVQGPITSLSFEYDEVGNRIRETNGRGLTTRYYYDENGNLTITEEPMGRVTTFNYDSLDRKVSMTDGNGNTTLYDYVPAGNLKTITDPLGNITTRTHDANGNMISETDATGRAVTYSYDAMRRRTERRDGLSNTWRWEYDLLGRLKRYIDANENATTQSYDALGRLTRLTNAVGGITEYRYDELGNPVEATDVEGGITRRKYDAGNRLIEEMDELRQECIYAYDGVGNLISRRDADGKTTCFTYDEEDRIVGVTRPDGSQVGFSYDANHNRISMTDSTGTTSYAYDSLDRLVQSIDGFGNEVGYEHDVFGNRTTLTYPDGKRVTYAYDEANRMTVVTDWADQRTEHKYDDVGRLAEVTYPNGITESRTYDEAARLKTLSYARLSETPFLHYDYVRDHEGNPVEVIQEGALSPHLNAPDQITYDYDEASRLLLSTEGSYSYDSRGNLTARTVKGIASVFQYDFENRLVSQVCGANSVQHVYNGEGNRVARTENGKVTHYVLDHSRSMSHILCETDASGNITAYNIHGLRILARVPTDNSPRYYHCDAIGNVIALTDENGDVTDRYAYTPYGILAGREGTTSNPFTYVGVLGVAQEMGGLFFMRERFYDPTLGRFLSREPNRFVEWPTWLSPYLYVGCNPIRYVDHAGTSRFEWSPDVPEPHPLYFYTRRAATSAYQKAREIAGSVLSKAWVTAVGGVLGKPIALLAEHSWEAYETWKALSQIPKPGHPLEGPRRELHKVMLLSSYPYVPHGPAKVAQFYLELDAAAMIQAQLYYQRGAFYRPSWARQGATPEQIEMGYWLWEGYVSDWLLWVKSGGA